MQVTITLYKGCESVSSKYTTVTLQTNQYTETTKLINETCTSKSWKQRVIYSNKSQNASSDNVRIDITLVALINQTASRAGLSIKLDESSRIQ